MGPSFAQENRGWYFLGKTLWGRLPHSGLISADPPSRARAAPGAFISKKWPMSSKKNVFWLFRLGLVWGGDGCCGPAGTSGGSAPCRVLSFEWAAQGWADAGGKWLHCSPS